MTSVDDKLKLFTKIVFEKVEKDSEEEIKKVTQESGEKLESEKQKLLKEAEDTIKQTKKKAENKKQQIISKANMDRQHEILKKKKEVYDRTVQDIKGLAREYTDSTEYVNYLENTIKLGLGKIESQNINAYFMRRDIEKYNNNINEYINKHKKDNANISILESKEDFIGGSVFVDSDETIRVDCSMNSVIEDSRGLIGKTLMDNLYTK
jgi:V/A-type H+-transporting ATPase subunit E